MRRVTQPRPKPLVKAKKLNLESRMQILKTTIAEMESLPPVLGVKWRDGMVRYYKQRLAELESYDANPGPVK